MSYCSLLIITQEPLDAAALDRLLDPWISEQLPEDVPPLRLVDVTDDLRRIFGNSRRWRVTHADGLCLRADDDRFYREPTAVERARLGTRPADDGDGTVFWRDWGDGRGLRPKIWFLPESWTRSMVPIADAMTFEEFVVDVTRPSPSCDPRDGLNDGERLRVEADGRVRRSIRTFPHGDYWRLGSAALPRGLKLKEGATASRGLDDPTDPNEPGYSCQALLGEVDFAGMRDTASQAAADDWDKVRSAIGRDAAWLTRDQVKAQYGSDFNGADAIYENQPALQKAMQAGLSPWSVDFYRVSREDHIARARRSAFKPEAVLKDDLWMDDSHGWFDVARDQQEGGGWAAQVTALLDGLPPDTCLTVVSYHL